MTISKTSENRANFKLWFARILNDLARDPHAGFATIMITLPLLERYLRQKTSNFERTSLTPAFHIELVRYFPNLHDKDRAEDFWRVFRHGILHQGSFRQLENGAHTSGKLANCASPVEIDAAGNFVVNPAKFAATVINLIENDFETFEAWGSTHHQIAIVAGGTTLSPQLSTVSFNEHSN